MSVPGASGDDYDDDDDDNEDEDDDDDDDDDQRAGDCGVMAVIAPGLGVCAGCHWALATDDGGLADTSSLAPLTSALVTMELRGGQVIQLMAVHHHCSGYCTNREMEKPEK